MKRRTQQTKTAQEWAAEARKWARRSIILARVAIILAIITIVLTIVSAVVKGNNADAEIGTALTCNLAECWES